MPFGAIADQEREDWNAPEPERTVQYRCPHADCGEEWESEEWGDDVLAWKVERSNCPPSEFDVYPNCPDCGAEGEEE